jgi:hypothetical protein
VKRRTMVGSPQRLNDATVIDGKVKHDKKAT